ncbi:MAG TPA: hydantoinase/oxoprolinase family protein [Spirillospora sp.]|nr:hydantoinase/oxoprolinase family protein [Spirillospora sp.]
MALASPRLSGWEFRIDRGGTSTDVSRYAGEFERRYETQVAGVGRGRRC